MAATTHDRAARQRELERAIRHVLELSRSRKRLTGKTNEMRKALKRVCAALRLVPDAGRALRAVRDAELILGVISELAQTMAAPEQLKRASKRYKTKPKAFVKRIAP